MWLFRLVGAALLTSGCGGSSTSPDQPPVTPPLPPIQTAPEEMQAALDDLLDIFSSPVVYTDLNDVPTTGAATFNGYFSAQLANPNDDLPDELISNLDLAVDFDASGVNVTGVAENFFDEENHALSGSLAISAGALDRTGNPNLDATFTAQLTGTLTLNGGETLDIESRFEGDFLGPQYDALGGAVFGRVTFGGNVQDIDGRILAAR